MALSLFAINKGYFDDIEVSGVLDFEKNLHDFFNNSSGLKSLLVSLEKNKKLDETSESKLEDGIKQFLKDRNI